MTWYEGFDIGEFEKQEKRMMELACYILTLEKERMGGTLEEVLVIVTEYEGYVTQLQLNNAVLIARSQPEYWNAMANKGLEHYRELFGED